MRTVDIILKKRKGLALSKEEIDFFIRGYTGEDIPDYQASALLMAIYFQGMNDQEVSDLTMAMVHSGDRVDLSPIEGIKVDKHSTGGVGDKISLIVGPLVAHAGIPVAKMSGRGLGHTGGTIDKLESIPGFQIDLTKEQFVENVNRIKMAIVGQTGNLAPADKKLYALRDVTATVDSIPLIASSIMSKKIASGADCIVLDVKIGSGAFMKSLEDAKRLARTMVSIGKNVGKKTIAVITDMDQPLGCEVGNANEVKEAIQVLQGKGAEDLKEISLTIASHMAVLGGIYDRYEQAYQALDRMLKTGEALQTLKAFVAAQGGDPQVVDQPDLLPLARYHIELLADCDGYVNSMDAESVGVSAMLLGAGRAKKGDRIDHAAGITLKKKVGDPVQAGEVLAVLHTNLDDYAEAHAKLRQAYYIAPSAPEKRPYVYDVVQ